MWICPKCNREFSRSNQGHYCGKAPTTVDEYFSAQDEARQGDLRRIRSIIKSAIPEAREKISWSMPTYWKECNIISFAAAKAHISLFVGEDAVTHFAPALAAYHTSKGTIRIPYGGLDEQLICEIAKWCYDN